jgi:hypothetical protein
MQARFLIVALLLTGCTAITTVRGPHATDLSHTDLQQIRRLAQKSPHLGHTVFTFDVIRPDEVHVQIREYNDSGSDGENFYVTRRNGQWMVDERKPRFFNPEMIVITN